MEECKVYVVTDTKYDYEGCWGTSIVGVYVSKDTAEQIVRDAKEQRQHNRGLRYRHEYEVEESILFDL